MSAKQMAKTPIEKTEEKEAIAKENEMGKIQNPYERVPIRLPLDNYKHKDALYVSVNDYTAMIPRGMTVMVPYYVAKVLEAAEESDFNAQIKDRERQDYFAENSSKFIY